MRRLLVLPEAARELREAARWYEAQRAGLGRAFAREVAAAVAHARSDHERFPIVDAEIRRVLLRRFPYGVYFRAREDVVVLAVFHLHRDPAALGVRGGDEEG